jgi:hypothetical protein
MGSFARVILFDKRGMGLSDRDAGALKGVPDTWRLFAVTGDEETQASG